MHRRAANKSRGRNVPVFATFSIGPLALNLAERSKFLSLVKHLSMAYNFMFGEGEHAIRGGEPSVTYLAFFRINAARSRRRVSFPLHTNNQ